MSRPTKEELDGIRRLGDSRQRALYGVELNAIFAEIDALTAELEAARSPMSNNERYLLYKERDQNRAELEACKKERDEKIRRWVNLMEEVGVARERLGPAGYQIIQELSFLRRQLKSLFDEIKHGADDHQDWLKKKIDIHFAHAAFDAHTVTEAKDE